MAFDKNNMSTPMKVVIIVFAFILVATLMLPSLAALVSSNSSQEQQPQNQQAEQQSIKSPEDVDNYYSATVQSLEDRLNKDPKNLAILNDLASAYFNWALHRSYFIEGDLAMSSTADAQKVHELFAKAVAAYDRVLAQSPSQSVEVDRAIALYHSGQTNEAIKSLENLLSADESYAPAWANLAMFYEDDNKEKAREAYQKALETSGDNQHIKNFVETRLSMLDALNATPAAEAESSDQ